MNANPALVIEPAASWQRLQQSNEFFFEDLDAQMKEHHRQFLEVLMGYERQCLLNAHSYQRTAARVDQANGFYRRSLTTRLGVWGKVQRRGALCAYGITTEGRRELIDFLLAKAEGQDTGYGFWWNLWGRGLRGEFLELIVTDGQPGLVKALGRLWPAGPPQRCWAHKLRNLESKRKASRRCCLEEAKLIYQAPHRTEALHRFRQWKGRRQRGAPKAVRCLEEDLEALRAFFDCPKTHWKRRRTTNVIERLFVEVRRRIRTLCAFTTRDSCERILFSVFDRMNPPWTRHPLQAFTHNS